MGQRRIDATTFALGDALAGHGAWTGLVQRLRASQDRWEVARPAVPAALAAQIRPGPLDDTGWTLVAPHGAAAAKLRQCLPAVEQRLKEAGWPEVAVRVKVGGRWR